VVFSGHIGTPRRLTAGSIPRAPLDPHPDRREYAELVLSWTKATRLSR